MHRNLLLAILASIGSIIAVLATALPLFEWQITGSTADFPPAYEIRIQPSPWVARLGDSLDHGLYVSFGKVYVLKDGRDCRHQDVNIVIKRSQTDETLETVALNSNKNISWLLDWNWIAIVLSIIYIWWFTIWYKRPIWEAAVFTVVLAVSYYELTQIVRLVLPRLGHLGTLECDRGTVTLDVKLARVHYEMPIVFLGGIFVELGALGVMARQIIKALIEKIGLHIK